MTEFNRDIILKEILKPTENNDIIYGDNNDNIILGGSGNDCLYGDLGNDVLNGGEGDDYLEGGAGNDTYVLTKEYGQDTIVEENNEKELNVIRVSKEILPEDIIISRTDTNLILNVMNKDKTINNTMAIENFFIDAKYQIKKVEFESNGTIWDNTTLIQKSKNVFGTKSDDYLVAFENNTTFLGFEGNDTIEGSSGNDIIDGGSGNDMLSGGAGNDTYIYKKNYGHDVINEENSIGNGADILKITDGITKNDIIISRNYDDMDIYIKDSEGKRTNDFITIQGMYLTDNYYRQIENVIFDDGSKLSKTELLKLGYNNIFGTDLADTLGGFVNSMTINAGKGNDTLLGDKYNDILYGEEGSDTLQGNSGNDLLDGGLGDDKLYGGAGDDTYTYRKWDGSDTIIEDTTSTGGSSDKIKLLDLTPEDITLMNSGNALLLKIKESSEKLQIEQFFSTTVNNIDYIEFSNGVIWSKNDIYLKNIINEGNSSNNTITGLTSFKNEIYGKAGNDILTGGSVEDILFGEVGNDKIYGKEGNDILDGGLGDDY